MIKYFYRVFNRHGECIWYGTAIDEPEAWKYAMFELKYPDAYPIEQITKGRFGLRICQWDL